MKELTKPLNLPYVIAWVEKDKVTFEGHGIEARELLSCFVGLTYRVISCVGKDAPRVANQVLLQTIGAIDSLKREYDEKVLDPLPTEQPELADNASGIIMVVGLQGYGVAYSPDTTNETMSMIHMAYWHLLTEKGVFDNLPYGDTTFTKTYDVTKQVDEAKKIKSALAALRKRKGN